MKQKTWFVTGTSQGLGLELVQQLLAKGYNVAATARNIDTLKKAVNTSSPQFLPLEMNLLDDNSINIAVNKTIRQFGNIDYLVNNAGYGLIGGIEECSREEVQASFDVNVFGLLDVTRAVLPHMRTTQSGHIFNISSVFGLIAGAGWGIYCASKFAVEGLSEALAQEVKPFGIKVTIIEPGYFRTNFLKGSSFALPKQPNNFYPEVTETKRKHAEDISGTQLGDPVKGAAVIISTGESAEAPLRLLLGSDALQYANYKLDLLKADFEANKDITLSTDY
ncbi:SDR family NAD(P)-dependent oxidoreductase [Chitinophaga oryziterrae]|uniref:SDR family NAD(P)-dependent oxidoreductase n=1 Tax=Chitinophaga oryziterrae TaxID=1031224 RepID=A0A6N8JAU3_9BACT|nr:oxidoreductase [Chitinophaga oryziterrae]MVT42350.1 SDR family NAD(P)-dependent oxidoreductase [Chitinophaga oryziterrae]